VWCWGNNAAGELGLGNTKNRLTPAQVDAANTWSAVSVSGDSFACAIRTDRTLWCWGYNGNGQLGTGDTTNRLSPTQVK